MKFKELNWKKVKLNGLKTNFYQTLRCNLHERERERERERDGDLLKLWAKSLRRAFKIVDCKTKENIIVDTKKKNLLPWYLSWYYFLRKNEIRDYFFVLCWTSYNFELFGILNFLFWILFNNLLVSCCLIQSCFCLRLFFCYLGLFLFLWFKFFLFFI